DGATAGPPTATKRMPEPSGSHAVAVANAYRPAKGVSAPDAASNVTSRASRVPPFRTMPLIVLPSGDHDGATKNAGARHSGGRFVTSGRASEPALLAMMSELVPCAGSIR